MIRTIATIFSLLAFTGCTKYVDTSCSAFTVITYSASGDTLDTQNQIIRHNAAWRAICN